ncbi:uncharacterized protein I303_102720 [Kwoniella dejecticola CBS 10117]|uniref:ATP-dependent helicase n=1 Tax=Kwoniella dejecticola CBS 10117 TaxID=1296121 RepID=A0A1A6A9I0_9TREE|nr:uncharacterized protein I303_02735 [Kwoniella dejecticola CBS 10117]OBR86722.1 hypothetical protein I303_02735 [Kwoniella dejecticola CBS 10117]
MSSAEAERKRREAIAALREKKLKKPSPVVETITVQSSPESHILVPPSSSPAPTPQRSKYFGNSNGTSSHPNGSNPVSRSLTYGSNTNAGGNVIPSSGIGRTVDTKQDESTKSQHTLTGSPQDVLKALHSRHNPQSHSAGGSSANSHSAFSFDASTSRNGNSNTTNPALLSPSSPQPLSRLKPRKYADPDEPDSPVQPLSRSSGANGIPSSPISSSSRPPSLVLAAQKEEEKKIVEMADRLTLQFRSTPRNMILSLLRKFPDDPGRAINQIHAINDRNRTMSTASATATASTTASPSSASATPPRFEAFQPNRVKPLPQAGQGHYRPTLVQRPSASTSSLPSIPRQPPKPKKNEKSSIYANRASNGKRRDPDETSSGGEGEMSDGDSEGSWSGDEGRKRKRRKGDQEVDAEGEALKAFNEVDADMLTGTIACSAEQAATIIKLRPYDDVDEARHKLTKARGVSFKLFEQYTEIMEGYVQIDACLNRCEAIATDVGNTLSVWRGASMAQDSVIGTPRSDGLNDVKVDVAKVSELLRKETDMKKRKILSSYIQTQPSTLSEGTILKDYQLLGVNWLNLLWSKKIGCILADEMGLGKTIQVISFIAHLKEKGIKGPHMIFVPASTLENWTREFARFAPSVDVQTYFGSQAERAGLREELKRRFRSGRLEVVLASYTQVASADDLGFFRKKIEFETCVYDEGHKLKSCTTKAYSDLLSIKPKWRLLLTGTPLQNNLQELVSLLMFIHKDTFADAEPYLRAIFKSQGSANLLSQQRTSRARTMLTPFVLRRRKALVLNLPPKIESVEHCEMTKVQAKLYNETMNRSRKVLQELTDDALENEAANVEETEQKTSKTKTTKAKPKKGQNASTIGASSSNILMDLRKAASHPLLFRRLYTDAKIKKLAKECLNTPTYCDSRLDYVIEDLEIMSDYEISHFCSSSIEDELRKYALDPELFLEGGKIAALRKIIEKSKSEGKRILLFSQFVMILDILEKALEHLDIKYTRLDGQTKTDERQGLVDEFNDDPEITVFLLSTKAGGVGINLTAASVVVIYDQDFNPHNDRQAADRAYRIGQEKEVEVIKLITKGSIDEDMLAIGLTKLQLDDAVGGEEITLDGADNSGQDDKTAKETRKSLLTTLRNKFVADDSAVKKEGMEGIKEEGEDDTEDIVITGSVKKARGKVNDV